MNLPQAIYELRFENLFLRTKGNEFQSLFERLMGLAYKADFLSCRPWGNQGDRKNDGFLKSERRLFQVYAPNEMTATRAVAKITEDLDGAKVHWGEHFDKWVFVHNAVDGLPPHVQQVMLDFEKANSGIQLEPWGLEEFRVVFRRLTVNDLASWLGPVPDESTKAKLGFDDLKPVLEAITRRTAPVDCAVEEVPMGKIEANSLSESATTIIKNGMTKVPVVEDFFSKWYDESLGESVAEAFRAEYQRLRGLSLIPNDIFYELQSWAGGSQRGTPEHEMAVYTVLAYYFERCDIFEKPRPASS
ncbi:MAG: ABC-three component system protein [Akkermansiaceae bacterium]